MHSGHGRSLGRTKPYRQGPHLWRLKMSRRTYLRGPAKRDKTYLRAYLHKNSSSMTLCRWRLRSLYRNVHNLNYLDSTYEAGVVLRLWTGAAMCAHKRSQVHGEDPMCACGCPSQTLRHLFWECPLTPPPLISMSTDDSLPPPNRLLTSCLRMLTQI